MEKLEMEKENILIKELLFILYLDRLDRLLSCKFLQNYNCQIISSICNSA